jgi:hypothetical protein
MLAYLKQLSHDSHSFLRFLEACISSCLVSLLWSCLGSLLLRLIACYGAVFWKAYSNNYDFSLVRSCLGDILLAVIVTSWQPWWYTAGLVSSLLFPCVTPHTSQCRKIFHVHLRFFVQRCSVFEYGRHHKSDHLCNCFCLVFICFQKKPLFLHKVFPPWKQNAMTLCWI